MIDNYNLNNEESVLDESIDTQYVKSDDSVTTDFDFNLNIEEDDDIEDDFEIEGFSGNEVKEDSVELPEEEKKVEEEDNKEGEKEKKKEKENKVEVKQNNSSITNKKKKTEVKSNEDPKKSAVNKHIEQDKIKFDKEFSNFYLQLEPQLDKVSGNGDDLFMLLFVYDSPIASEKYEFVDDFYSKNYNAQYRLLPIEDYKNSEIVREKYVDREGGFDEKKFEEDYINAARKYSAVVLNKRFKTADHAVAIATEEQERSEAIISTQLSRADKSSIINGMEVDDGVDLQKSALISFKDKDGNFKYLSQEEIKKHNGRFSIDRNIIQSDPKDRVEMYITPFSGSEELLGRDVVSVHDMQDGVFNMAKKELTIPEMVKFFPKSLNNAALGLAGGILTALQTAVVPDNGADAFNYLQELINDVEKYKIGSTTKSKTGGAFDSFESIVDQALNGMGQIAVMASIGLLTRRLGPVISAMTARIGYTATVLDGVRKEALEAGMDEKSANFYTTASALGFFAASKLEEWAFLPGEVKAVNKSLREFIKKDAVDFVRSTAKAAAKKSGKTNMFISLMNGAKKLGIKTADLVRRAHANSEMVEGFIGEGVEESIEEVAQEMARQFTNYYKSLNNVSYDEYDSLKGRFSTFGDDNYITNVMKNVSTAGVLGGISGGMFGGVRSIMGHKLENVHDIKSYSDIIMKGNTEAFVNTLNKAYDNGDLGSKYHSYKKGANGDYLVVENEKDSQAMLNYTLILNNLSTVKESMGDISNILSGKFEEDEVIVKNVQDKVYKLMDGYKKFEIGDNQMKTIEQIGLDAFNKENGKDISVEDYEALKVLRDDLVRIRKGEENVRLFIKSQIKENPIFGSEEFRAEEFKDVSDDFYEETLTALAQERGNEGEVVNNRINKAKVNDTIIDSFIEAHNGQAITSLDSFIQDGVLLLSKSSIDKIIAYNEEILNSEIKPFAAKYKATPVQTNDILVDGYDNGVNAITNAIYKILFFNDAKIRSKELLAKYNITESDLTKLESGNYEESELSDVASNYDLKKRKSIVDEYQKINDVDSYMKNTFGLKTKDYYKANELAKKLYDAILTTQRDKNVDVINKAEKVDDIKIYKLKLNSTGFSNRTINALRSFVDPSQKESLSISELIDTIVNDDSILDKLSTSEWMMNSFISQSVPNIAQHIDRNIYEFNNKIKSLSTVADISSANFDNKGYLNAILKTKRNKPTFEGSTLQSVVSDITSDYKDSIAPDGQYTYNDEEAVAKAIRDISVTNAFFSLSFDTLGFLGKLQRQIHTNSLGNQLTFKEFQNGSNAKLGTINKLIAPALYDVERIAYLEKTNNVDNDEYRRAMAIKDAITFNDENINLFNAKINDAKSFIEEQLAKGNLSKEDKLNYKRRLAGIELRITEINNSKTLSEEAKQGEIKNANGTTVMEKLIIINNIINEGKFSITEKHEMSKAVLNNVLESVKSRKNSVVSVNYTKEIKDNINDTFKKLYGMLNTMIDVNKCN